MFQRAYIGWESWLWSKGSGSARWPLGVEHIVRSYCKADSCTGQTVGKGYSVTFKVSFCLNRYEEFTLVIRSRGALDGLQINFRGKTYCSSEWLWCFAHGTGCWKWVSVYFKDSLRSFSDDEVYWGQIGALECPVASRLVFVSKWSIRPNRYADLRIGQTVGRGFRNLWRFIVFFLWRWCFSKSNGAPGAPGGI